MLQVSPASGANDLVSEFIDSDKPSVFQPGGDRTFGRVIPSDFAQGQAAAVWADELEVEAGGGPRRPLAVCRGSDRGVRNRGR